MPIPRLVLSWGVTPILASVGVPTAAQCLRLLAPLGGLFFLWWLIRNADRVIRKVFPTLEWQMQLGWLNIRAERRAAAVLRWVSYAVYAALVFALGGIVLSAYLSAQISPDDPENLIPAISVLPILFLSLAIWTVYLIWGLIPKLRREYEREELERFRAENASVAEEEPRKRTSTLPLLIAKARSSARSRR